MGDVVKHVQIPTTRIGDAQISEPKFAEHFERGTAVDIVRTAARTVSFETAFGGTPDIAIGITSLAPAGTANTVLIAANGPGSFQVSLLQAGTAEISWQAWGPRA